MECKDCIDYNNEFSDKGTGYCIFVQDYVKDSDNCSFWEENTEK